MAAKITYQYMVGTIPPSIRIGDPLNADAYGLHKNVANLPISSGLINRCISD